jgi:Mg/Co/Ni transporter MgtE
MSARIHAEHHHDDRDLSAKIAGSAAHEAIAMIAGERDETIAQTLEGMNPSDAVRILWELPDERRARVLEKASPEWARQWTANHRFPEDAIGRLMAPSFAAFPPEMTVGEANDELREIVKRAFVSYAYVVDRESKLISVAMLLYATSEHVSSAWTLGAVVAISMTIACTASGVSGVVVPIALRRMGADPVTASSIFLTTATDCTSMGIFLGLATLLIR